MWVALENNRICQLDSIWFTFVNEKKRQLFSLFCQCAMASPTQECKKIGFCVRKLEFWAIFKHPFWELLIWQMFEVQKEESFPSHPSVVVSLKVAISIWKAATFECKKLPPPFFHKKGKKGMKSTRKKVETFIIIFLLAKHRFSRRFMTGLLHLQTNFSFLRDIGTVLEKNPGSFSKLYGLLCAVCCISA